jgi:hypothetical protein
MSAGCSVAQEHNARDVRGIGPKGVGAVLGAHAGGRRRRLADDAGRWQRLRREARWVFDEQAEDEAVGSRGARCEQSRPALLPECLADLLVGGPSLAPGSGRVEADAGEPVGGAEIGNLELRHLVAPEVAWELVHWRYAPLGEVPVPLGPEGVLGFGEVERVDDGAALPAVVAGRPRTDARVGSVGNVTQPGAGRVDRVDVERQRAGPQTAPGDSSSDTIRATRRALPRAISSSGFWSSSASIGRDSQTGM